MSKSDRKTEASDLSEQERADADSPAFVPEKITLPPSVRSGSPVTAQTWEIEEDDQGEPNHRSTLGANKTRPASRTHRQAYGDLQGIPCKTALTSLSGYVISSFMIFLGLSWTPTLLHDIFAPQRLAFDDPAPSLIKVLAHFLAYLICLRFAYIALRYSSYLPAKILFTVLVASLILPFGELAGMIYSGLLESSDWGDTLFRLLYGQLKTSEFISISFGVSMFVLFLVVLPYFILRALFPKFYLKKSYRGLLLGVFGWSDLMGEKELDYADILLLKARRGAKRTIFLDLKIKGGLNISLDWKDVCEHIDTLAFLDTLRQQGVLSDLTCIQDRHELDNEKYTQLWLKYFSSSKRKRSGTLNPGDLLHEGRYRVIAELGQGGQGTAYLACLEAPGREAAGTGPGDLLVLKEYILPVHRGDEIFQQSLCRLEKEVEILASLKHPNIVAFTDSFVEDHRGYLVMEYVEGQSLKELVAKSGPQPENFVVGLALQVCDVLEYLHGRKPAIIHRDLTPDNLILQESGVLKLVDFNVAQQLDSSSNSTVVGKHAYIPPEQFRGKASIRSDIYALGATLYFLLTGREPEPLSVSCPARQMNRPSSRLDKIVSKATALDERERYSDIAEMRKELLDCKPAPISSID